MNIKVAAFTVSEKSSNISFGIVIPWVIRLYVEIIQLCYTTYTSVVLAHNEIFQAKVCMGWAAPGPLTRTHLKLTNL